MKMYKKVAGKKKKKKKKKFDDDEAFSGHWTWTQCCQDGRKDTVFLRNLVLWAAPRIWHVAYGKRIPSQAKLWIYVPVIPNTHTLQPPVAVCRKKPLKNDISTGHKINSQTLSKRHSQAVLLMLRTPRTM